MTELEKLKRAQEYIEKLSRGINPLNDFPVPVDDTVNYDRISRCLCYVAEVLNRDIEREELQKIIDFTPAPKVVKDDFSFPLERRDKFQFSDVPITVSEIVSRINAMSDGDTSKKLKATAVFQWLTDVGILEMVTKPDGKNARIPTDAGFGIGIETEVRTGQSGEYEVILYNRDAQQFIIDNIDAIIEINNRKTVRQRKSRTVEKPWTNEQDEYLRVMFVNDVSVQEMAESLMRSESAVSERLKLLGLVK